MNRPRLARACALLLLAGAAGACREREQGPARPLEVATVHGVPITLDQFVSELAFARRTSAGVVPHSDAELAAFRRATLEELIDRTLVLGAAREAGVTVAADKVDREMLRLEAEYHGGNFGEALAESGISQQELRERTRARLVVERYFVDEVFSRVAVTDPEIESWYRAHADELAQPEQVRAAQIVVKTAEEARRILGKIREGMAFDEAARRWSLSPDAKVGGDLGFFKRGVMPPVFDQACFGQPVGRISDVVSSEYGFHLFKILDRRPAEQRSLQKVRGEIERQLLQAKREEAQKRALLALRAGPEAAACRAVADGAVPGEEAVAECLQGAATRGVRINESVLAGVPAQGG